MRIIPTGSSRAFGQGLLVAVSLAVLPTPVAARQGASGATPRQRADGWKSKSDQAESRDAKTETGQAGALSATKRAGNDAAKSPATRMLSSGGGLETLAAEKAAIDKVTSKTTIDEILAATLPPRSDRGEDWSAGPEPLHRCGEPRWLEPCIPLPPCHPSLPPQPFDLVGVAGDPTDGPIYRGPCCPRTGTHDGGALPGLHHVHDRLFDAFYRTK